jgi:hypothetical protein
MKANSAHAPKIDEEPLGIIISRGSRQEPPPMVFAYVWGPAPESDETPEIKAA